MDFTFLTPPLVRFGRGCITELGKETKRLGNRALLVTGRSFLKQSGILDRLLGILEEAGVSTVIYDGVSPEPLVDMAEEARELLYREGCNVVIGAGGGSALDTAKSVAALAGAPGRVAEYLNGKRIDGAALPWVAVPTTAGTGSEATPTAVFTDPARDVKTSMRGRQFMAAAVLVDPELTLTAPPHITAHSGMDALTQAIESLTSRFATPLTKSLSLQAAELIISCLPRAVENGQDIEARENLALGSLMAGIALANARLGVVHGLAHPVGHRCQRAHGLVCAVLLPPVMEFNLPVAAGDYALLARRLDLPGDNDTEKARALVTLVRNLNQRLGIPSRLKALGLKADDIPVMAEQALPSGSTKANPRPVSREDLEGILDNAL
ncbi:iron-containing alcohol dehydrogenase family protein [Desulfofundulus salinus]|uniref:Iron-containing alcohol dehydrogenase n=1 Tax=Desulfofundulus salinus TaxID=2419843 RepID=A0A494X324_9FIRM|nr:iron-containing alcohol dehydrogenase [Desulfofundulus salinum]RKO67585.1 iron-containing alcohol dehydrogenase [Desulfofundulus salinum]